MAGVLGRPLRTDEHVHHRNHVKHDNRPSNLVLLLSSRSHPHDITPDPSSGGRPVYHTADALLAGIRASSLHTLDAFCNRDCYRRD